MSEQAWAFHPDALAELDEAGRWYEERHEGLGEELVESVYDALTRAAPLPSPGVTVPGVRRAHVRRLLMTPRFPFAVILLSDERVVLAVAHLSKRPNYWRARLPAAGRAAPPRPSRTRRA
jgi:hypothetical protein